MLRHADGSLDLSGFPARDHFAIEPIFDESMGEGLDHSIRPVIYFRFEGAIEDATVEQAMASGAIRLVDADPRSSARGEVIPVEHRIFRGANHVPDTTLAVRPRRTLRSDHLYLALVMRDLGDTTLGTTDELERIKNTEPVTHPEIERVRALHAGAFDRLHEEGIGREQIAGVAMFRTQDAMAPVREVMATVSSLPAPKLLSATWRPAWDTADYRVLSGYYCTPNLQSELEHAPFIKRGGRIVSKNGRAEVAPVPPSSPYHVPACGEYMRARVVIAVPRTPMPPQGWPLLVYGHGTTGDATSVLGSSHFAGMAARAGMASASTDQPLHGSDDPMGMRPGSDRPVAYRVGPFPIPLPNKGKGGELGFYNVLRPLVLRDNLRQAIADAAWLARMTLSADWTAAVGGAEPLRFHRDFGYIAAGHSQGSQPAAVLGAMDPLARAVVLSAAGGDFSAAMFERKDAKKMRPLVELILSLADHELDGFHPFASAIQSVFDPVDPQTYGASYQVKPRSVLLVSGAGDTLTVDAAGAALAREMGLTALAPMPRPLRDVAAAPSVQGNGPDGKSTLALLQVAPSYAYEPHFVMFRERKAQRIVEDYLRALANGEHAPTLSQPASGDQQRLFGK